MIKRVEWHYNNLYSEPSLPKEFEKKSQSRITVIDHLKSLRREFKIVGLWLIILQKKISHLITGRDNKEAITKLKTRITHLEAKDLKLELGNIWKTSMEVPSRNVVKMDYFSDSKKYTDETTLLAKKVGVSPNLSSGPANHPDIRASLSVNGPHLESLPEAVREGVCAGGCIDFARHMLIEANQNPAQVAKLFKSGMGAAAVANQHIYRQTLPDQNIRVWEHLQISNEITEYERGVILNLYNVATNPDFKPDPKYTEKHQNLLTELKEKTEECRKKGIAPSKELLAVIQSHEKTEGNIARWLYAYVELTANTIDQSFRTKIVSTNVEKIRAADRVKNYMKQTGKALLRKIGIGQKKEHRYTYLLREQSRNLNDQQVLNRVMKARGLQTESKEKEFGISGRKNDKEYLTGLSDTKEGIYYLVLDTDSGAHATLFLNQGKEKFFWDPNYGLLRLDPNNPQKIMLKVLSLYDCPKENKKGNHNLHISEISSLKQPDNRQ